MPHTPWSSSSRTPSGSSNANDGGHNPAGSSNLNVNSHDRPSSRVPPPSTLRPQTQRDRDTLSSGLAHASNTKQVSHNRSSSNPLPKLFSRKKSNRDLRFEETEAHFEDDLLPDVDDHTPYSSRKIKPDGDDRIARRCMCCNSRVKVPSGLSKFRCMCCLTVNDLIPFEDQPDGRQRKYGPGRPDAKSSVTAPPAVISLERTRSIIDQCVVAYLKARCGPQGDTVLDVRRGASPRRETLGLNLRQSKPHDLSLHDGSNVSTPDSLTSEYLERSAPDHAPSAVTPDKEQGGDISPAQELATPSRHSHDAQNEPPPPTREPPPPPPPPAIIASRPLSNMLHPRDGPPHGISPLQQRHSMARRPYAEVPDNRHHYDRVKIIFKPLEDYLVVTFGEYQCLNKSFHTLRPAFIGRTRSESNIPKPPPAPIPEVKHTLTGGLSELDAKTLLLGDIGENGSWWTGRTERRRNEGESNSRRSGDHARRAVSSRSPNINWQELNAWYGLIHTAGTSWRTNADSISAESQGSSKTRLDGEQNANEIDQDLLEAKEHTLRALLKITENVLKRPSRPMKEAEETRFLFIVLSNPSLYQSPHRVNRPLSPHDSRPKQRSNEGQHGSDNLKYPDRTLGRSKGSESLPHSGILKRTFGLLANAPEACHRYFIGWFAYLEEHHFVKIFDLVALFVTHRISHGSKMAHRGSGIDDGGLIPDLSGSASSTSAQLLTAMGLSGPMSKKRGENGEQEPHWADDWQLKAAAKVMSLLFTANNIWHDQPRGMPNRPGSNVPGSTVHPAASRGRKSGQLLHTSAFYNTLLDFYDMIADYRIWEAKRDKFAFCQYPLFLSMGTKIKILEYDARRQMEIKAREAYFDQVVRQRVMDGHFHLRIRRECIVDDSLRQISEAVGAGQEELKKGLRVHFTGEEGVDAGGPRKEWFLMLVRDIFDPNHGMFIYDEDSNVCYFNSNSFETSDQYYLVGALLGLAIYNSTILDVALPSFVFRKLLSAAPMTSNSALTSPIMTAAKVQMVYTLADLAEFRPTLAAGLQQLLDFEGDVESTYCWDFVASQDRFGTVVTVPLKPNGENIPVTNANRHEFVDTYVRYLLDGAVARQFEPFKRGFFTVCASTLR